MSFSRAYCISAACNPSRVATLTGLRPSTSGVYQNASDWRKALPKRRTIMQQFQAAGYAVRGAGKIFITNSLAPFMTRLHSMNFSHGTTKHAAEETQQGTRIWVTQHGLGRLADDEKDTIDFRTTEYCIRNLKTHPRTNRCSSPLASSSPTLHFLHRPSITKIFQVSQNQSDWIMTGTTSHPGRLP